MLGQIRAGNRLNLAEPTVVQLLAVGILAQHIIQHLHLEPRNLLMDVEALTRKRLVRRRPQQLEALRQLAAIRQGDLQILWPRLASIIIEDEIDLRDRQLIHQFDPQRIGRIPQNGSGVYIAVNRVFRAVPRVAPGLHPNQADPPAIAR